MTDWIEQLQQAAGEAGDRDQVALCTAALAGDTDALAECERVRDEAATQDEPSPCAATSRPSAD